MGLWSPYSYKLRHMSAGGRQWWELRNSFFSQRIREEKYTFSLWNRSQAATWRWVYPLSTCFNWEILNVLSLPRETIHESFPVSHVKFNQKGKKIFWLKVSFLFLLYLSSEALSESRAIFFCRKCYCQPEAEHSAVGLRSSSPMQISPHPHWLCRNLFSLEREWLSCTCFHIRI